MIKKFDRDDEMPTLRIVPIMNSEMSEERRKGIMELQLEMATSSINHEYARMEYDGTSDTQRRDDLLGYMQDCRLKYFEARESLERFDPMAVADFERELLRQKMETMTQYNA